MIDHTVENYETWKPHFDDHATTRAEHGSQGYRLLRGADDPNRVTIVFEWDSLDNARSFAEDPDLAAKMEEAGVTSEPTIVFLEEEETTTSEPTPA